MRCPVCKVGTMNSPPDGQESYIICNECESIHLTYKPLPHQARFHADPHKFKGFFGGFGSGKTRTGAEEITQHILSTPGGMTLIGAQTKPQLDQTAKKMFFDVFPRILIEDYHKQREEVLCKNGHIVLFRPLDDEGKIRSLNLSAFWIEEASEVKYDIFVQLQTRLRNTATKRHLGILTSNPDMGWIKTEFLLKSDKIYNAMTKYYQNPDEINKAFSSHIAPTSLNPYLPPDFMESVTKGKPQWWVERFFYGSFEATEGLVFPEFSKHIVDPFSIPRHWERVFAADFGLRDPTVLLAGAIDPDNGILYIYDEHYESGRSIKYHAEKMNQMLKPIRPGLIRYIVGDPKGKAKSERDMRSIFDYYAEYGIYFKPGINKIEDGILKVYSYFEMNKLKIFSTCRNTIREGLNYKYKPQDLDSRKNPDEKPLDKDNHAMDALRYMVAELPDDPEMLKNFSYFGSNYYGMQGPSQDHLPFALRDDDISEPSKEWVYYY